MTEGKSEVTNETGEKAEDATENDALTDEELAKLAGGKKLNVSVKDVKGGAKKAAGLPSSDCWKANPSNPLEGGSVGHGPAQALPSSDCY